MTQIFKHKDTLKVTRRGTGEYGTLSSDDRYREDGYYPLIDDGKPTYDEQTQKVSSEDVIDNTLKVWNRVYTVTDKTQEELDAYFKASVPKVITMRQARLALLQSDLLATVTDAINNGTDETLKIEWEYATECRRDWQNLINMATVLGITERQLDELFIFGGSL